MSDVEHPAAVIERETCREIQREYATADVSIRQLAEDYGVSIGTIDRHVSDECVHRTVVSEAECASMRERYDAGAATVAELAAERRWSRHTLCDHIHGHCGHSEDGRRATSASRGECPLCDEDDLGNLGNHLRSTCPKTSDDGGETA